MHDRMRTGESLILPVCIRCLLQVYSAVPTPLSDRASRQGGGAVTCHTIVTFFGLAKAAGLPKRMTDRAVAWTFLATGWH